LQETGLLDFDANYWKEVTPHEVSHQWWGNLVALKATAISG
jgi:aminopeptidase N